MTTVVYDACVLYPAPLRDLLMHLALTSLYRARWTDAIHEEWIRNVLQDRPDLTREKLNRVRALMDQHVEDALVVGYESRVEALTLPDPNDRHVLAAALEAKAEVIVTFNLKDFPAAILARLGVEARHPDEFVGQWLEAHPGVVCAAVKRQRESLRNPPKTVDEFLAVLESCGLPSAVARLREFAGLI